MVRVLAPLVLLVAACGHNLDAAPSAPPPAADEARSLITGASNSGDDGGSDDDANDDAGTDDGTDTDGNDDGTDDDSGDVPDAPGPPPSEAQQSCGEWSDCGPRYADLNSGFDCADHVCVCNVDGNWDDACSDIGGFWSEEDCFCYVNVDPPPSEDADEWVADDEEQQAWEDEEEASDPRADRVCWWRWRDTGCDPDTWVDTGGYEYVCDGSGDCSYEYEEDGYWEPGKCRGYWLRRCSDGTERRF